MKFSPSDMGEATGRVERIPIYEPSSGVTISSRFNNLLGVEIGG